MNKKMVLPMLLVIVITIMGYLNNYYEPSYSVDKNEDNMVNDNLKSYTLETIPDYDGEPFVILDDNIPHFTEEDKKSKEFEIYQDLDALGRTTLAFANIGPSLMPTEERGNIGNIKPSGWHTVKYDIVSGKYLYNRCHLIGYQLTGENANEKNLITCTRYMNTVGMLGFEDMVADYIKNTNNHVLYRVTPIYKDDNLLASGVVMEALSLEDDGEGIKFNVYIFNVQDGIEIDYKTGDSRLKNDDI